MRRNDNNKNYAVSVLIKVGAALTALLGFTAILGWIFNIPMLTNFGADNIPMALSTAILFVGFGLLFFLHYAFPANRSVTKIGIVFSSFGILAALTLLYVSINNIHLEAEHFWMEMSGSFDGLAIGYMSPITAFVFIFISVSFILLLSKTKLKKQIKISFILSVFISCISVILILSYIFGTPLLYEGNFIPPALTTSLAFLFLGMVLLIISGLEIWPGKKLPGDFGSRSSNIFFMVFVFLIITILTASYSYYKVYEKQFRTEVEQQVTAIGTLKANQITQWRKERLADGEILFKNTEFTRLVNRIYNNRNDFDAKNRIQDWIEKLRAVFQYSQICLQDINGDKISTSPEEGIIKHDINYSEAVKSGLLLFNDLYRDKYDKHIYMNIIIPVFSERAGQDVIAVLIFWINPEQYLFPLIKEWPTVSKTAETLLIRREGNEAVFLNELKFQKNTALNLRKPIKENTLPAGQAVLGKKGITEGKDYRGVPVIAYTCPIPNSPWFMVARMDISEVYAPLQNKTRFLVVLVLILFILSGSTLLVIWRNQRLRFFQDKHSAAEKLIVSESRYRRLFETTKDGILILDAETGKIVDVNPYLIDMLGYSHEELFGKELWRIGTLENIAASKEAFLELQNKGYIRFEDMPLETKKGNHIEVEFVSNIYFVDKTKIIQCNIREITARKLAERKLKESEENFRSMFENNSAAMAIIEPDTTISMVNDEYCRLGGYIKQEVTGTSWLDQIPPEDLERLKEYNRIRLMNVIDAPDKYEFTFYKKNGEIRNALMSVTMLKNKKIITSFIDITERKLAEEEIKKSNEQLVKLNAEKDKFFSIIAHDLKSPFNGFLGLTELMADSEENFSPEEFVEYSKSINRVAHNLYKLLENLLEWSQVQKGAITYTPKDIDLSKLVLQSIDTINPRAAQKRIAIINDAVDVHNLYADEKMISTVLRNLLANAVKFTRKDGKIIVKSGRSKNGAIEVSVTDNGIGIPEKDVKRLFKIEEKVGSQGTDGESSTGLGLLLCKEFIEMHGGKIWVESEEGKGSKFIFTLHKSNIISA